MQLLVKSARDMHIVIERNGKTSSHLESNGAQQMHQSTGPTAWSRKSVQGSTPTADITYHDAQ